jgi:hypothetical protein
MAMSQEELFEKRLEQLEYRLDHVEAERAIARTMYHYIEACDRSKDAGRISSLFTEDAVWEGRGNFAEFGQAKGRTAIREMFVENPEILPFTAHYLTNPVIGVSMDQHTGWGQWQTLEAATYRRRSAQVWIAAWYDNDFEKVGNEWLIKHLRFTDIFVAPYEEGWLRARYVSPNTLIKQIELGD